MIWKSINILKVYSYTILWNKPPMLKGFLLSKTNVTKNAHFFISRVQLITVLLLINNYYTTWNISFISKKLCLRSSIFDSVSLLLIFIFLFNKNHTLWLWESMILFKKINTTATHSLSFFFKLQQKNWRSNDICASWTPWPKDEILSFLKSTFWACHFFSIGTFK